jgi:adenylate cyclase
MTGELLVIDKLFLQTIEGPKHAVYALWRALNKDPRHTDPVLVCCAPIDQRKCDNPLRLTVCDDKLLGGLSMLAELLGQLARSMSCLETYVPHTVVRHILAGRESRMFAPVRVSVVMMASDIVCFTSLSEGCLLTEVWHMCTTFIDLCTREIQKRGGQVIKLIGDCVMAYFAPNAAMAAVEAAQGLTRNCVRRRQTVHPLDCRSVMACGVGLDYGPVVMMHCGNTNMSRFIVTGEIGGRVMEVEALSRPAGRKIILTQPLREQLPTDVLLERLPEPCQGVPCFSLSGEEWQLDWSKIEASIKNYHGACRTVRSASVGFLHAPSPHTLTQPYDEATVESL